MSMHAKISTDSFGDITVHVQGGLEFGLAHPFVKELHSLSEGNPYSKITLDLHKLDFVGSSGINHFVDTLKSINGKRDQIRLSNVKSEFLRVFKLYQFDAHSLIEDELNNDDTEHMTTRFGGRKYTFEN